MNQTAKVLLIEDNPGDAKLVEVLLDASGDSQDRTFELMRVGQLSEAFPLLDDDSIKAILLDLGLPDGKGLDTLIRVHAQAPMIPIVVLSAEEDELLAIRCVQNGAQDFLIKHGISEMLLRRAIWYAIERKHLFEQLQYMAHFDILTGLANRKQFYDRIKQDWIAAERAHTTLALIFIDLNDFKAVNDSLGHVVGDDLLKEVARRLLSSVRASDCVARMGGDEFTVILNQLKAPQEAALIAEKIMTNLSAPFLLAGCSSQVRASIGIATYPHDCDEPEQLIEAADAAMYKAKVTDSDKTTRYCFYSSALSSKVRKKQQRFQELSSALRQGQFELFYQPQFDLHSGKIVAMEALLRWRHAQKGLLAPQAFMDELEESGLIVPVGDWVLEQALEQCQSWRRHMPTEVSVSVNISSRQFRQPDFVGKLTALLDRLALESSAVELDFHEQTLWENEAYSQTVLQKLHIKGVRLALDNFGSGLISLKSLLNFPLHLVKIDPVLLQQQSDSAGSQAIAKAAVEIAHLFRIKGMANGVETSLDLERVRNIACDHVQGYLYSKPLPAEQAMLLLIGNQQTTLQ
ncbi:MAG: EAL domain-containing protein [Methylococcales bacterium]|nr:EAL domain-containing protein [Methylococcales bacterium]